mmetsp:Transcript_41107/g.126934  ORF Transcript_41107/g.126934 Transcript_41107/m.126934 type:complete len:210 (-) Transcript_41107:159-788(-)
MRALAAASSPRSFCTSAMSVASLITNDISVASSGAPPALSTDASCASPPAAASSFAFALRRCAISCTSFFTRASSSNRLFISRAAASSSSLRHSSREHRSCTRCSSVFADSLSWIARSSATSFSDATLPTRSVASSSCFRTRAISSAILRFSRRPRMYPRHPLNMRSTVYRCQYVTTRFKMRICLSFVRSVLSKTNVLRLSLEPISRKY